MQTKHKQLVWGFLSIMIMLLIFYFSADTAAASDAKSSFIVDHLYPLVQSLLSVDAFTFLIRKTAHFSIYAALGFCVFHFVSLRSPSWKQACWITIFFCFCYACSDEFHQLLSDGRSGQFSDVLLDTCGSMAGSLFARMLDLLIQNIRKREKTG